MPLLVPFVHAIDAAHLPSMLSWTVNWHMPSLSNEKWHVFRWCTGSTVPVT